MVFQIESSKPPNPISGPTTTMICSMRVPRRVRHNAPPAVQFHRNHDGGINGKAVSQTEESKTKVRKAKPPNIKFLTLLVKWRNDAQNVLFRLLQLVAEHETNVQANERYSAIFQLLTGAAFYLWRAVFLAEYRLQTEKALKGAKSLLNKVVSDNAIAYSDEKASQRWTAGFYVSHIQYRMHHLQQVYGDDLDVPELIKFARKWNPIGHQH